MLCLCFLFNTFSNTILLDGLSAPLCCPPPGCSKAVMPLAHMANSWNLPIITPVGNTEIIGNKNQFPRLTRTSYFMQGQFADVAVFLMEEYLWNTVAVINDQGTLFYDLLGLTFDQILDVRGFMANY